MNLHDVFTREVCAAREHMAVVIRRQERLWQEIRDSTSQWHHATEIVCSRLPLRGWYLSGQEPAPLVVRLAKHIEAEAWADVDRLMLQHVPLFRPEDHGRWLGNNGVPSHCIDRFRRFVGHHQQGNYEEATFLGLPLIDEVCLHLYGVEFTRKGKGSTQPAIASAASTTVWAKLGKEFVSDFGSLQDTIVEARLHDEDYWCRHAILHGKMQRPMGLKDSAKCCLAIAFLIHNRDAGQ